MAKVKSKNPVGRPPFEITQEILEKVESLAARGLKQEQIADCLGIHVATLCNKKNEFVEFVEAIKKGKSKGIAMVTAALIKNVNNGNPAAQMFYLKCQAQWKETNVIEGHLHITHEQIQKELKELE